MTTSERLASRTRPLTASEKRLMTSRIRTLRTAVRGARNAPLVVAGAVAFLWGATLLASDAPWWVITAFWLVVGGVLHVWVRREQKGDARQQQELADRLESALRADRAVVLDVRATRFVEFEEIEDEGACYAFATGADEVVVIAGQQFYPEARFPSLDFSLVYPQDEQAATVSFWMEKRGERAEPARVIPANVKRILDIPEHLTVVRCDLDRLEDVMRRPSRPAGADA